MEYGNSIVDTRKLSKDKKASLGRGGDTEIGVVDNKETHLNAWEVSLIDSFGEAGEQYVKDVGSGTINPITGLKEYDIPQDPWHGYVSEKQRASNNRHIDSHNSGVYKDDEHNLSAQHIQSNLPEGFEPPADMTHNEFFDVMNEFDISTDDLKWITEHDQESLDFITDQHKLTKDKLDQTRDFAVEGAQFEMQGLRTQFDDTTAGLSQEFRGGMRSLDAAQSAQAARSGFATTDTWGMQQQMKDLTQQYTQGTDRARRDLDFSAKQVDSSMRQIASGYDLDISQAAHDRDQALFQERKRQTDTLYDEIAAINASK